ncbi:MAG: GNAT family N-acetyltransferase, partial [Acidobacteria bacterium]|nr:GNAT family N-acetyltransferase [Acidobacteriota bacterium]
MIRAMRLADIPAAMRLKEAAGWNQIEQDWANVLAMEPEGCWVEELDG